MWAVCHLQLFTVQKLEVLSLPFMLAQHGTQQFSLHCRHSYASVASPLSPHLRESGAAQYFEAPTALCGSSLVSTSLAWSDRTVPDCVCFSCCSLTASASADVFQLCPLQLLLPDCVLFSLLLLECIHLLSCTHSTKYNEALLVRNLRLWWN